MGKRAWVMVVAIALSVGACAGEGTPVSSQSAAAADRDGVVRALASLPLDVRSRREATVRTDEGEWVISRPSETLVTQTNADGCRLGPEDGEYGRDMICVIEYGEVLLIADGKVRRAYPMPSLPPTWIHADADWIYGGREGDGCLPYSSLFRINRRTFAHELVVFPQTETQPSVLLPHWRVATASETPLIHDLGGPGDTAVTPVHGTMRVNIDRVARLFDAPAAGALSHGEGAC